MASLAPEFVGLLRCPVTGQRLSMVVDPGFQKSPAFESLRRSAQCWLLRADGRMAYPVRNGLPILLKEEGVALSGDPEGIAFIEAVDATDALQKKD
jgi:uncharacterized protein YbaR (Trm112 family)